VVKTALNKNEYHFYKNGKHISTLKFIDNGNKFGIKFDWVDDEEKNDNHDEA